MELIKFFRKIILFILNNNKLAKLLVHNLINGANRRVLGVRNFCLTINFFYNECTITLGCRG